MALEGAGRGVEFGNALDRNQQRAVDVLFGGDDVAHAQPDQLAGGDSRLRQADVQLDQRRADRAADLLDAFGRGLAAAVGHPAVGRQLAADPLDRVVRDAEVHHSAQFADRQSRS